MSVTTQTKNQNDYIFNFNLKMRMTYERNGIFNIHIVRGERNKLNGNE